MNPIRGAVLRATAWGPVRRFATGPVGWRVASRFVAGDDLTGAFAAAALLRSEGIATILDHLGENAETPAQEDAAVEDYVAALEGIRLRPDLGATISIKLTQLGLDTSVERCLACVERVLDAAGPDGPVVMIDMEASAYVDRTLAIHAALRERGRRVGIAVQSYLRRTPDDVAGLPADSVVRLVKGAYLESPSVAFERKADVDAAYASLCEVILARGHTLHVATHDAALVAAAESHVTQLGIGWDRVEFQMLYGIRTDLQRDLAARGRPVRVYVPYGTEWYPYFTRRLAERPANLTFFVSNLLRRA